MLLPKYVLKPFTDKVSFDYESFKIDVKTAQYFLDDIIELSNPPLKNIKNELLLKRKRGLGFMGLADVFIMFRTKYGSAESIKLTKKIIYSIASSSYETNVELAKLRGPCPIAKGIEPFNKETFAENYCNSLYIQNLEREMDRNKNSKFKLTKEIKKHGVRYTHGISIAPTGTTSIINNYMSSGVEPVFSFKGKRNVIVDLKGGNKFKKQYDTYNYALIEYYAYYNPTILEQEVIQFIEKDYKKDGKLNLPDYFVEAQDVSIDEHLNILKVLSPFVDHSISKTINIPEDLSFEDYKEVYMKAHSYNLKGITTFRYNPEIFGAILVNEAEQKNTIYKFITESGEEYIASGDEKIKYRGQEFVASNLFECINTNDFKTSI